jgi:hypothetical protein
MNVGTVASARDTERSALIPVHDATAGGYISGSHAPYSWIPCDSSVHNVEYTYALSGGAG